MRRRGHVGDHADRNSGQRVALLVVSLLGIAAGMAVIAWPDVTVAVVGVVIGAGALFTGIGEMVAAFELKHEA